ncbi:unnamed protein product [Heterobilharzia americana]|nr:unnamed protein product [Heterobilharzia americana]
MNSEDFNRLLSQQTSDLEVTEQEIIKLEKYKLDYETVSNKIEELQKSVYKEAYIPFSRKALVKGRLIHTNELLVYLGGTDDYFAELSVYETVQLITNRIKQLENKLNGLNQQKILLNNRINYTKDFIEKKSIIIPLKHLHNTSSLNVFPENFENIQEIEIREEYDSDIEIEWRKKHSMNRKQERLTNALQTSPVINTRKVSFDLTNHIYKDNSTDSENISDFEGDNLSIIHFQHSNIPSLVPREKVIDFSSLTVAEAVNFANNNSSNNNNDNDNNNNSLCSINDKNKILSVEPFGDIHERQLINISTSSNPSLPIEKKRCSQFRSSRIKDSKTV